MTTKEAFLGYYAQIYSRKGLSEKGLSENELTKYLEAVIEDNKVVFYEGECETNYASWHPLSVFEDNSEIAVEYGCPDIPSEHISCLAINGIFLDVLRKNISKLKTALAWANSSKNNKFVKWINYKLIPLELLKTNKTEAFLIVVENKDPICQFVNREGVVSFDCDGIVNSFELFLKKLREEVLKDNVGIFDIDYCGATNLLPPVYASVVVATVIAMKEAKRCYEREMIETMKGREKK